MPCAGYQDGSYFGIDRIDCDVPWSGHFVVHVVQGFSGSRSTKNSLAIDKYGQSGLPWLVGKSHRSAVVGECAGSGIALEDLAKVGVAAFEFLWARLRARK